MYEDNSDAEEHIAFYLAQGCVLTEEGKVDADDEPHYRNEESAGEEANIAALVDNFGPGDAQPPGSSDYSDEETQYHTKLDDDDDTSSQEAHYWMADEDDSSSDGETPQNDKLSEPSEPDKTDNQDERPDMVDSCTMPPTEASDEEIQ